jgi:hypothetical protein
MEPVSISAIIIAIISALGVLLSKVRMKHCLCGCIESDCITSPPTSPQPSVNITDHTPTATPQPSPELKRRKIDTEV